MAEDSRCLVVRNLIVEHCDLHDRGLHGYWLDSLDQAKSLRFYATNLDPGMIPRFLGSRC